MRTNILIVDDNPHFINQAIDILSATKSDYYFYPAKNGVMAYRLAILKKPDLIITDWDMPIVNGIELIKNLKKNKKTKEIPVIMATGLMLTSEELKIALDAGAIDYIRKPIDKIELVARTQSVLKITEYYKKIIENKNILLIESSLQMVRNTKFNNHINLQFKELRNKFANENNIICNLLNSIEIDIDDKIRTDSWNKFCIHFDAINYDFKRKILKKYPNLTNLEIKLSMLIKLGMSIKDIAIVLYQTVGSIRVARSRLRKKLKLKPKQNLQIFLSIF